MNNFRTALEPWVRQGKRVTVHTVGFSPDHDYEFLNKLRTVGTTDVRQHMRGWLLVCCLLAWWLVSLLACWLVGLFIACCLLFIVYCLLLVFYIACYVVSLSPSRSC